jgi:hypothetical protein
MQNSIAFVHSVEDMAKMWHLLPVTLLLKYIVVEVRTDNLVI